jgi:membrane protein
MLRRTKPRIAYSTVFAIAPLMIVAVAIAGGALGVASGAHEDHIVEDRIIGSIAHSAGPQAADMVRATVDTSFQSRQGSIVAQIAGWATFVLAASGLLLAVQNALNRIWHVAPRKQGIWQTVRNRIASMAGSVLN